MPAEGNVPLPRPKNVGKRWQHKDSEGVLAMAKAGTDYQTIADKYERSLLAIQWKVYKAVMVQSGAYEAMTEPSAEIEGDKAVEVPELVQEFLRAYHLPVEVFNDISETERRREAESERIQLAKSMLRKRTPKGKEDQEPGEQVTETKTSKRRRNRKNRGLRGIVTGESVKNMSESTLRRRIDICTRSITKIDDAITNIDADIDYLVSEREAQNVKRAAAEERMSILITQVESAKNGASSSTD